MPPANGIAAVVGVGGLRSFARRIEADRENRLARFEARLTQHHLDVEIIVEAHEDEPRSKANIAMNIHSVRLSELAQGISEGESLQRGTKLDKG